MLLNLPVQFLVESSQLSINILELVIHGYYNGNYQGVEYRRPRITLLGAPAERSQGEEEETM